MGSKFLFPLEEIVEACLYFEFVVAAGTHEISEPIAHELNHACVPAKWVYILIYVAQPI